MLQKSPKKTGFCIKTTQNRALTIENTIKYITAVIYTGESSKHPLNFDKQWRLKQKNTIAAGQCTGLAATQKPVLYKTFTQL